MSRLSGRGRGALCAIAVSSAAGILLAAKTFVLGDEGGSAEVAAWLAGLPEGTIVAIAAGGGGPEDDSTLDAGLAEALAGLAGDVGPDAEAESTPPGSTKSKSFALVGWKGAGQREWARRQHWTSGAGGGRCALYAELLLAPPDLGADQVATDPKQVELQDKLCLCPLRSAPGDETLASARGFCRREGEPTVSVGPTVDLVDCPGWTTTLQAPQDVAAADGAENEPSCSPAAAWMVTSVFPAVGETHEDTEEFDDGPVG